MFSKCLSYPVFIAVLMAAATAAPASAASPPARAAATCSDFSNQADAQRAKNTRDSDGDGLYCESLPCPCLGTGGGGGGGGGDDGGGRQRPDFPARIVRVTDGDTVVVRSGTGRRFRVRLIGIDTPEVFGGLECGGRSASASMKRLAPKGRRVRVFGDPTQARRDSFGRLLAYVKTRGGPQLNIAQVRRGWAKVFVFGGKPFRQTASFRRAAGGAKRQGRGVWGQCGGNFHQRVQSSQAPATAQAGTRDCRNFRFDPAFIYDFSVRSMTCKRAEYLQRGSYGRSGWHFRRARRFGFRCGRIGTVYERIRTCDPSVP